MSRKLSGLAVILLLWACVCLGACAETVTGDLAARFADTPRIEHEGVTYKLRSRLTTILLAGIDRTAGATSAVDAFRSGGQADFLLLLVIDGNRNTVQPIHINRDTMTEITIYNILGRESGTRTAQICLAHGFGDGREQSCERLVSAMQNFLLDTPIDHYAALNMAGIAALNDALGGVTVTLEEDFTAHDPEMIAGTTLTLKGAQAEIYVGRRYYVGEQTNTARMRRQQQYIKAAAEIVRGRVKESGSFIASLFGELDAYLVTDMARGKIVNLSNQAVQYEILPMLEPSGEAVVGDRGFMEFYPSEDSVRQIVLQAFYAPEE